MNENNLGILVFTIRHIGLLEITLLPVFSLNGCGVMLAPGMSFLYVAGSSVYYVIFCPPLPVFLLENNIEMAVIIHLT